MSAADPGPGAGELIDIRLDLPGGRRTTITVGPGALALADGEPVAALVADARALALHGQRLPTAWRERTLELPPGEEAKTWAGLGELLESLAEAGLERGCRLGLFGGGATGDVGGLAAALYLRGVPFVSCPTTLLAQVDASVGGKTAVNLPRAKNLVGAFHQPQRVLADTLVLATLPRDELASGLGEVVKTALIAGPQLLARVEALAPALLEGDPDALALVVADCVRTKARVVAEDEREAGRRAVLNLGHTFGHAIEAVAGYGIVPHGVCVAVGLGCATDLAARCGTLEDLALPERLARLLRSLGLPAGLAQLRSARDLTLHPAELRRAMDGDKKRSGGRLRFVLPRAAGAIDHGVAVDEADLSVVLAD
ncbi:3-dehydroquinate synthase [Engelhardtia mirabilis]|uniref:3-dehydroquinate synthase n=1 Tax=Engelhardtia mirabilis TaxID=2528011 RepID=A0A518BSJ5_9BACT|nr:3-dehydroquinate synthase [Planctomycetes bacterium Pla133]QDV04264.1 3-dehydroquinate synthase [Planctomycetes bacterium Pla86]